MAQVFHHSLNPIGRMLLFGFPFFLGIAGASLAAFYRSPYVTGAYEILEQPAPFSHKHHVGQLGIDCRYCHTSVEKSHFAGIPPTQTCMNCHQQMWTGSDMLGVIRDNYAKDKPVDWKKVHNLPHYVYFNHSIHVAKGVGCQSCHGQLNEMHLTFQTKTLLMEWCLSCHREPEKHLRPKEQIYSMTWSPDQPTTDPITGKEYPTNQAELGKQLKDEYHVRDAKYLTSCSMCHR
jgi:hypothetical protein